MEHSQTNNQYNLENQNSSETTEVVEKFIYHFVYIFNFLYVKIPLKFSEILIHFNSLYKNLLKFFSFYL